MKKKQEKIASFFRKIFTDCEFLHKLNGRYIPIFRLFYFEFLKLQIIPLFGRLIQTSNRKAFCEK